MSPILLYTGLRTSFRKVGMIRLTASILSADKYKLPISYGDVTTPNISQSPNLPASCIASSDIQCYLSSINCESDSIEIFEFPADIDVSDLTYKKRIRLDSCFGVTSLDFMIYSRLEVLHIINCSKLEILDLSHALYITTLELHNVESVTSISLPEEPLVLLSVKITRAGKLSSLDIEGATNIRSLDLYAVSQLNTITLPRYPTSLCVIYIEDAGLHIVDLSAISELRELELYNLPNLDKIHLPDTPDSLKSVDIRQCNKLLNQGVQVVDVTNAVNLVHLLLEGYDDLGMEVWYDLDRFTRYMDWYKLDTRYDYPVI